MREGKVKVTPNRRRVLESFLEEEGPWTLGSLHRKLSEAGSCDISSVYRALEALSNAGLLEEFHLPGEKQTFYSLIRQRGNREVSHPHHHHIVCQDCGRVSHLDVCLPSGLLGKVEGESGFRVTEHHLEFRGICGDCVDVAG
jgi:Fe2+ or Zn2+ uptake regulation protein